MSDPVTQLPESFDSNKAINLSLGMASPLWLAFAGAAMAGSAFWWMSRWTRPDNLEAMLELPATPPIAVPVPDVVVEAVEPVAEAAVVAATAVETAVEVATEEAAALVEGLAEVDPVVDAPLAAAAVIKAAEKSADDLTKLVGIGPKLAASLRELGVTSFAQIAAWTADDLAKFDAALALKGRAARDAWVAQARRLADA
jgi:predicted flap endonuclease-1-like 5' DNA nuclease